MRQAAPVTAARPVTAASLAEAVGGDLVGPPELILAGFAPLETAGPGEASFLARPDYRERAKVSKAGIVLVARGEDLGGRPVINCDDPYVALAAGLRLMHPDVPPVPLIDARAVIEHTSQIDATARVEALAVIGARTVIGPGVRIGPGAVVAEDCTVGEGSTIHSGAVVYPRTEIGRRVIVHAGAVLGSDGFGYAPTATGGLVKIPQVGRLVIEDDVEIGAGTCIDRGALGETRIGAGVKIDNLVQVAHNVIVGPHSVLVAQSGIAGSTTLGRGVQLAGQSGISGHLVVGDFARIAAKSAVLQDVEPGASVAGIPAMPLAAWRRTVVLLAKLPELARRLRRIETGDARQDDKEGDGG